MAHVQQVSREFEAQVNIALHKNEGVTRKKSPYAHSSAACQGTFENTILKRFFLAGPPPPPKKKQSDMPHSLAHLFS